MLPAGAGLPGDIWDVCLLRGQWSVCVPSHRALLHPGSACVPVRARGWSRAVPGPSVPAVHHIHLRGISTGHLLVHAHLLPGKEEEVRNYKLSYLSLTTPEMCCNTFFSFLFSSLFFFEKNSLNILTCDKNRSHRSRIR